METIEEKRKNWLDSHLKIYLDDPSKRSVKIINCFYRHPKSGNKCMIGQDIPDDLYSSSIEGKSVVNNIIINMLPDSTKELGTKFLNECQSLHDDNFYWNKKGLTTHGKIKYDYIIEKYCKQK